VPEPVGFIGLGIMGARMAANLRRAGHELVVHNRTRATAEAWAREHGAEVTATPAEVGARCAVVFTMVVDGEQVAELLLGGEGVASAAREDLLCVDCSTIGPAHARAIGERLAQRGAAFVDAPVTGSAPRAQDGTLTIMAGGAERDFERARPLLEAMGNRVLHVGPLGHGQAIKVINNSVAAVNAATVAQALVAGRQAGVDLDALVAVMSAGSGSSTMLELKSGPMREHDYAPLFKLAHMLKDVDLCLEETEVEPGTFAFADAVREILAAAAAAGHGDEDFAALLEVVEQRSGTRL
jgi:3-hydroxyisobutyrate dehydrogenase-like beta-hydroxyacid dehydrogenase